ncbi:uncharacterized protein L969DRAFT_49685 [Mixia osmundae IAM 14324]|uniref:uncharacterized protein n=1 Tax=Mixia osmundae (strain CBS 9802 / IAM 14324 / JCM 22182 / KY 12970) TaxID=764103 RepID=UPI0004A552DE|nr:uncharacterized protein L969DRAFT_49685 [Mixia osmundae IAM 14324]KEI38625.1 hypothetical protein L969DRAFT_49685 [Mixia osmundae IAM 14324]
MRPLVVFEVYESVSSTDMFKGMILFIFAAVLVAALPATNATSQLTTRGIFHQAYDIECKRPMMRLYDMAILISACNTQIEQAACKTRGAGPDPVEYAQDDLEPASVTVVLDYSGFIDADFRMAKGMSHLSLSTFRWPIAIITFLVSARSLNLPLYHSCCEGWMEVHVGLHLDERKSAPSIALSDEGSKPNVVATQMCTPLYEDYEGACALVPGRPPAHTQCTVLEADVRLDAIPTAVTHSLAWSRYGNPLRSIDRAHCDGARRRWHCLLASFPCLIATSRIQCSSSLEAHRRLLATGYVAVRSPASNALVRRSQIGRQSASSTRPSSTF